jgi:hypothetical protein
MSDSSIGGICVSQNQSSKYVRLALLCAAVAAWNIYDLSSATEAPRQAVVIMQYTFLAGSLLGLAGALFKLVAQG